MNYQQSTSHIVMIEPTNFFFNEETALDNAYQQRTNVSKDTIQKQALSEFNTFVSILKEKGIKVSVIKDQTTPYTPDSIFPNNWFSTHCDTLILYPMFAQNRHMELIKFKNEIISLFNPQHIIDFSDKRPLSLEGTGAIVFDRVNKVAYCSLSARANQELFEELCSLIDYTPISFHSYHLDKEIYHTNVLMSITSKLALVGISLIEPNEQLKVIESLQKTHTILELTPKQIHHFAGNALEVSTNNKSYLVLSQTALNSLSIEQIKLIETYHEIISVSIPTIETLGGGSVRCMMAEIFE